MVVLISAGDVERCGAVPGCKMAAIDEAGDVCDVAEQACRAGGADSVQLEQGASGGGDELGQFLVGGLDPLVDRGEIGDQLGSETAAGLADDVAWPNSGEQRPGLGRGQELLRPAGQQFQ